LSGHPLLPPRRPRSTEPFGPAAGSSASARTTGTVLAVLEDDGGDPQLAELRAALMRDFEQRHGD